ncbi:hypothetical protein [Peribacillus butanolivorans]|uniref:hypothetical protein n=1 Tax=Peribacillus butanolivorans TaxID=421767 RepID=UPI003D08AFFA
MTKRSATYCYREHSDLKKLSQALLEQQLLEELLLSVFTDGAGWLWQCLEHLYQYLFDHFSA